MNVNIQIVHMLIYRLKSFVCIGFHRSLSPHSLSLFSLVFFNEKKKCFFFRVEIQNRKYHYFIINCARDPAETNIKHNNRAVAVLVAAAAAAVFSYAQPVHVHKIELNTHSWTGTWYTFCTDRPTDPPIEWNKKRTITIIHRILTNHVYLKEKQKGMKRRRTKEKKRNRNMHFVGRWYQCNYNVSQYICRKFLCFTIIIVFICRTIRALHIYL